VLASGEELERCIPELFAIRYSSRVAYLYRYLANNVSDADRTGELIRGVFDWENQWIQSNQLQAVGLRIVGAKVDAD